MGLYFVLLKNWEKKHEFSLFFFFAGLNFWFFALFFSFLVCHRLIVWKRTRKQTKFGKTTWKQRLKHANVIQFSVSVILLFFLLCSLSHSTYV